MPLRLKLLLGALLAAGLSAFVISGVVAGGSGSNCKQPDAVVELIPNCGDAVFQQARVGVAMKPGYTAELTINGTPVPQDQVTGGTSVGQNSNPKAPVAPDTFVFVPGPGKIIEQLPPENNVLLRYWRLEDGEDTARTFTWRFRAT
jgi:hypothetical protein